MRKTLQPLNYSLLFFLERGEGREKERKRVIDQLPLAQAPTGDQCATQACAPTGNQTGDLSPYGMILNQLSHDGQGLTTLIH